MRIKATRNLLIDGAPVEFGAVLDVPDTVGRYLMLIGKAVEALSDEALHDSPEGGEIERAVSRRAVRAEKAAK